MSNQEAEKRKIQTVEMLRQARDLLQLAQNEITDVEGDGSAEVYSEIADLYQATEQTRIKVSRIRPTGLFQSPQRDMQ